MQVKDADLQQGDAEVIDEHIDDARGTCDVLESLNQESGWVSSGDEEMTWKYANVDTLPGGTFLSKVSPGALQQQSIYGECNSVSEVGEGVSPTGKLCRVVPSVRGCVCVWLEVQVTFQPK